MVKLYLNLLNRKNTKFPMGMHFHPMGPFLEGSFGNGVLIYCDPG